MAESSAAAAAPRSDAETEELLDRMLTRLALCDDSKLEALLSKLLPLTISSLSSQSLAVRNKVLEILSHVNKRVKHQPEIGLPFMDLWKMYGELNAPPMVKNFCIIYIEMAFERINLKVLFIGERKYGTNGFDKHFKASSAAPRDHHEDSCKGIFQNIFSLLS
ncbi:hypothetical protein SLEP1_g7089 [Rubroshorea leprosula]|uniref:Proteasome component Ecm29 N-terminal domain-containing protein n=1 Tax=Rubroshorea leprosula TaxID=152421 RepID=A0AAV5I5J2_9ROSI|nr:hypothetical protein SLEP1_g7089 [Rubroshorea leprosula]